MELTLDMNFSMDHMDFVWNYIKVMSSKPRVLLRFLPNPKIFKSKHGKTLNSARKVWNPPFEDGFMV